MAIKNAVKEGWEFTSKQSGAVLGAARGATYVAGVDEAIQTLNKDINAFMVNGSADDKLKGFIAEAWHADTFNINAALRDSASRAARDESNKHASVDVTLTTGSGDKLPFSMKYYATGGRKTGSAAMQAKNVIEAYHEYLSKSKAQTPMSFEEYLEKYGYSNDTQTLLRSVYYGQGRIIPEDQLADAIDYLKRKMAEESLKDGPNRALVYENYKETLEKLSDRIRDNDGVESIPLSKDEAEVIAALSKEEGFDAGNYGISLDMISREFIMKQAMKAGYTAAVISFVMQLAPEVYKAISYLIENGEIDIDQLRKSGLKALSASATGFIRGSVSCGLTIACHAGRFGSALMNADPSVIGAITVLVIDTIGYSMKVATGKMKPREMGYTLSKEIIISVAAIGAGMALQSVIPVIGYLLGSFLGSVLASTALDLGEKVFLGFCADTGFTCFGLVEQNYEVPSEVLEYLGIREKMIRIKAVPQHTVRRKEISKKQIRRKTYRTIDVMVLRRGVVGINKIGYVIQ